MSWLGESRPEQRAWEERAWEGGGRAEHQWRVTPKSWGALLESGSQCSAAATARISRSHCRPHGHQDVRARAGAGSSLMIGEIVLVKVLLGRFLLVKVVLVKACRI
jgi:hypothetical protein